MIHVIENFTKDGYAVKTLVGHFGQLNGYVGIPINKYRNMVEKGFCYYNDIYCHGGVTFSEQGSFPKQVLKINSSGKLSFTEVDKQLFDAQYFWLGFDTAHHYDSADKDYLEAILSKEDFESVIQYTTNFQFMGSGPIRTHAYVMENINDMLTQIKEFNKEIKKEEV